MNGAPVRRRHVLFFGGFDPKGAAWYHGLYRRHAAQQSTVNGMMIETGPRRRDAQGRQCWDVRATTSDGIHCDTVVEVAAWDDVVRRYWPRSSAGVLREMLVGYGLMLRHGAHEVFKVLRVAPRRVFALFYPLLFFVAGFLGAALLGLVAFGIVGLVAGPWLARATGLAVAAAGVYGVLRLERRLDTSLLARIYAFVSRCAVWGVPEIERMVDANAARLRELLQDPDIDEVLVVGFSVGSILATHALGRMLEREDAALREGATLGLLTLGNCIPLYGLFPQAEAYRAGLAHIAGSDALRWVDVSSPSDWGSFPLIDPLALCEVPLARRGRGAPVLTSPRFHTLFSDEDYRRMLPDKHTMHMLYLMSTQKPGKYDYFAITAGTETLDQRYGKPK